MKFFTDKSVINDYLLIKITDYLKLQDKTQWKEIFIDPEVYQLKKRCEYSWEKKININEFLDSLPENHYFSFDYPCDMNPKYTSLFLQKSWENAKKYCNHSQYIVTIQSSFHNYWNFKEWFDKYNALKIESNILGLGNLCRIFYLDDYIRYSLSHAFKNSSVKRIHVYGLGLRNIPFAYHLAKKYNIELSIDSTKWTRPHLSLRNVFNRSCNSKEERQLYFDTYLKEVNKACENYKSK